MSCRIIHYCRNGTTNTARIKNTRARFKYGLRILKQHKNQIISNSLAAKLQQTRPDHFWKEINRLHSSKMPTPNCMDGVTGANDIVELWKDRFQRLLNCIQDDNIEEETLKALGPFYLVYMPGEVKYPTHGVNV